VYDTNDFDFSLFFLSGWAVENQVVRKVVKTHHTEVVESWVVKTTMRSHFRSMKQKLTTPALGDGQARALLDAPGDSPTFKVRY
jgi:hypothetical protein